MRLGYLKDYYFFWVEDEMTHSHTNNCYRCRDMEHVNDFIQNYSIK